MKRTVTWGALALAMTWSIGCSDLNISGPVVDWPGWPRPDDPTAVRVTSEWRGQLAPGQQIEIKGVFGDLTAIRTTDRDVVVVATRIGQPDEVAAVSIEVVHHEFGVTICAVYPDVPGQEPNSCQPGAAGNLSAWDGGQGLATVDFAVAVPDGVTLVGKSVSGGLRATGLRSDAFLSTLQGAIQVSTTRLATARTLSGSITASIGLADWDRDLEFSTMSGNVQVTVPAATNAEVRASARSGRIVSDFPLNPSLPGEMHGTIGTGGPTLRLTTLAGDIALRRGP